LRKLVFTSLLLVACASTPPAEQPTEPPPSSARPPRRPGGGPGGGGPGQKELEDAIALAKSEDLDGAIASCKAAVAKGPQLEQAYLLWGSSCSLKEDAACEREAYGAGLKALPRSAPLHKEQGFLELREGQYDAAIKSYEEANKLGGADPETLADLAYAYALARRVDDGAKAADSAVAGDAKCFHCRMMQGEVRLMKKDTDGAAESFLAATKIDPKSPDAKINLAKTYFVAGRLDEARPLYEELVKSEPDNARYRIQAAQVASAQKKYADAVAHLAEVAKANPEEIRVLELLLEAQNAAADKKGAAETNKRLSALKGKKK
jgi:tetratricopeptide (TPR) repeat protein